jgi:hypothetical protein
MMVMMRVVMMMSFDERKIHRVSIFNTTEKILQAGEEGREMSDVRCWMSVTEERWQMLDVGE